MLSFGENVILGLGNPLIDLSINADEKLLEKYSLDANSAILAGEEHNDLYTEIEKNYKIEYIVGGATQNVLRVAQWILRQRRVCTFMGCVGTDELSNTLMEKASGEGLIVRYQHNREYPTGKCAVLVTKNGMCRSMVTDLGAANHFKQTHLDVPENRKLLNDAKFYYISGYFLTVSPDTIMEVGEHACHHNKVFGMNLSAPFLCEFFSEPMMKAMPYVDYLFGNETEAAKFGEVQQFGTNDLKEIALKAYSLPKANKQRTRVVIFTQGIGNIVVVKDGKVTEYPVTQLPEDKIIDTNGAGDAFAGGFLSQLIQGKPIEDCMRCGIWAATQIIQLSGCTCPDQIYYNSTE